MKHYAILFAFAASALLLSEAAAQKPGIVRLSPTPAELGRGRFFTPTPPLVMGTPGPFFARFGFMPVRNPYPIYPGSGYGAGYSSMGGYGSGSGYGSYGSDYGYSRLLERVTRSADNPAPGLDRILTASGVPAQNGQVSWPLGLRLLRVDELLRQLEAQLQLAASQYGTGSVSPQLLAGIRENTETVRQALAADKAWRFSMPLATYRNAELFLSRLEQAPALLQGAAPSTGQVEQSQRQLQTAPTPAGLRPSPRTLTVGVQDNAFEPKTISVPPGTTVRWVNYGKHAHTVTADDGLWDSGDLPPGEAFSQTFHKPGSFSYHCRHHQDMQGVVVVARTSGD